MFNLSDIHFFTFIVYIVLSFYVLTRGKKDVYKVLSLFLLSFALWSIQRALVCDLNLTKPVIKILHDISSIGWIGFASFFLWFICLFVEKKQLLKRKIFYFFLFLFPTVLIYAQFSGYILEDYIKGPYGWIYVYSNSVWTYLFYVYYLLSVFVAWIFCLQAYKKEEDTQKRNQIKIILISTFLAVAVGTIVDVVLVSSHSFPPLGDVVSLIWALALVYIIAKHHFLGSTKEIISEQILAVMAETVIILDKEGCILSINNAAVSLLRYEENELKGKVFNILFREDTKNLAQEIIIAKKSINCYSIDLIGKDESIISARVSTTSLLNNKNNKIGTVVVIADLSEHKRLQEALISEEKKIRTYLDIAVVMIVVIDKDKKVSLINRRGCQILGYKEVEIVGKDWFNVFIPQRLREEGNMVFDKIISGNIESFDYFENEILTKSGEERLVAWNNTLLKDETGKIISLISSGEDITERKIMENELKKKVEDLQNFHKFTVGRELKMKLLKKRIIELEEQIQNNKQ